MAEDGEALQARHDAALLRLVHGNPLAWIVAGRDAAMGAVLAPLRPRLGGGGSIESFAGHLARANSAVETLRRDPLALILFLGPHGYISPSWLTDRTQAPTWNYASAQFLVEVEFVEEPDTLRAVLEDLAQSLETGRPDAWRIDEMGERYGRLAERIVGFVAHVRAVRPGFKLSQADAPAQWGEVIAGLNAEGATALAAWMADARAMKA